MARIVPAQETIKEMDGRAGARSVLKVKAAHSEDRRNVPIIKSTSPESYCTNRTARRSKSRCERATHNTAAVLSEAQL
jgi:hypothetical protein